MYNTSIQAQQTLFGTVVTFSLSETSDTGETEHLVSATVVSTEMQGVEEDPLWIHLEQVLDGVVKTLSTPPGRVWPNPDSGDVLDGGWGGAGQIAPHRTK